MAKSDRRYAFLLHADHWLSSEKTRTMTLAQRGAYIDLLCIQWQSGSIPKDPKALAGLLGVTPKEFARVWRKPLTDCFVADPENGQRLVNLRLIAETEAFLKRRARFQEGALKTNLNRWNNLSPSERQAVASRSPGTTLGGRNTNTNIYRGNSYTAREGEWDRTFSNGKTVPNRHKNVELVCDEPSAERYRFKDLDTGKIWSWSSDSWVEVVRGNRKPGV
jgi:uncharacterized protein YdaU (DUF1376 family)